MMNTFKFIVSTPDGNLYEGDVVSVFLRGAEGDLAIMAGHTPFVTSVKPCDCRIDGADSEKKVISVERGLLSVTNQDVTLMSGGAYFKS